MGAPDAQVAVYAADIERTWVAFGLGHQCIMVKRQDTLSVAFVSPKNGKVYDDWVPCKLAAKGGR